MKISQYLNRTNILVLMVVTAIVIGFFLLAGHTLHAGDAINASLLAGVGMTTLAANKPRSYELGDRNEFAMGAVKIYEGSAVGLVAATGYARALQSADRFVGFAESKVDNSAGSAGDLNIRVVKCGVIQLSISGLVITDVGLPVYASDDDTFSLSPVGGKFIGFVRRYVSAGVGIVEFDAPCYVDPYAGFTHVLKSANYTVAADDDGKWIWVDTDAVVITLPAVDGIMVRVGNIAAFGVSGVAISPNASDLITGPGITAADNKDLINTKATSRRGDFAELMQGDADGWMVTRLVGTWAREA